MLSKEGKVGLVISVIGLVLLGLAPTQSKRAPILGKQFRLVFHTLDGLREGDPVAVGGVDAGRVVEIDFAPREDWEKLNRPNDQRPVVLVTVALSQGFDLGPGTSYRVESTLRGYHMINIIPPAPGSTLPSGSILNEELAYLNGDQLQYTLDNFKILSNNTIMMREQFSDPKFRGEMKDLASNMRFYSSEFMRLSHSSRAQVGKLADQLDLQERALLEQTQRMEAQTRRMGAYFRGYTPAFRNSIAAYKQRLAAGQKQLDQLYRTTESYGEMFRRYETMLKKSPLGGGDAQKTAQRLHDLSNQLEDYANLAGDLHQISSNPQVQKDLKGLSKRFKARSERLKEQVHGYQEKARVLEWIVPQKHHEPLPLEKPNTPGVGETPVPGEK